jgi:hypothetical protein
MAKSKDKQNKSQLIRDALREFPSMSPTQIVAALKAKGVTNINAQYVSTIKSNAKAKAGKTGRAVASVAQVRQAGKLNTRNLLAEEVVAAYSFVRRVGGSQRAHMILDTLDQV